MNQLALHSAAAAACPAAVLAVGAAAAAAAFAVTVDAAVGAGSFVQPSCLVLSSCAARRLELLLLPCKPHLKSLGSRKE